MQIALNIESCTITLGTAGVWDYTLSGSADLVAQKTIEMNDIIRDLPSPPDNYSWNWATQSSPPNEYVVWTIEIDT